jgi:hypothetical protein
MDIPKTDVGGRIAEGQDLPCKERQGLPEATPRGNRMRPLTWAFKERPQTRKTDGKTTDPLD